MMLASADVFGAGLYWLGIALFVSGVLIGGLFGYIFGNLSGWNAGMRDGVEVGWEQAKADSIERAGDDMPGLWNNE